MTERDAVFVHMHRGSVSVFVRRDLRRLTLPRFAVVATTIDAQWCRWVLRFDKGNHIAGSLVDREAAGLKARVGNHDFGAERIAAIGAATHQ